MTSDKTRLTTEEVVARFDELAQQEKWFDVHDELFADTVRSIEPPNFPILRMQQVNSPFAKREKTGLKRYWIFMALIRPTPSLAVSISRLAGALMLR